MINRFFVEKIIFTMKNKIERLFSKYHYSKNDLYSLDYTLIFYVLPRIKAYRNMHREGTPHIEGLLEGNEKDINVWNNILDEMILGLECYVIDFNCTSKLGKESIKHVKQVFGNWEARIENNIHYSLCTEKENGEYEFVDSIHDLTQKDIKRYEKDLGPHWFDKCIYYFNEKVYKDIMHKANEGLDLFGKYYRYLYD